jgi:hypothetical protein
MKETLRSKENHLGGGGSEPITMRSLKGKEKMVVLGVT